MTLARSWEPFASQPGHFPYTDDSSALTSFAATHFEAGMNEDPTLQLGAEPTLAGPSPAPVATWGTFHLLARVGAGGFGEVYRAWDPTLQREVALKLLLPNTLGGDDEYESTLREARALASLKHPNIVSIYGVDRHNGRVGFWTDFVRGKTLSALLGDHGPFGYREAALIALDVTRALSAVHRAGLLHRDIKPENVMREEGGRILLMDFGLSTLPHRSNSLSGTLNYMAPELFRGSPATVAADIYAVGVLLYYLVTGTHPVRLRGLSIVEAATAVYTRKPLIDQRSDLPESFLRVVNTAIDLDPAKRFASAGAMAEALAESIGVATAQPATVAAPVSPPQEAKRSKKLPRWAIAALVLALVFGSRIIGAFNRLFPHKNTSAASSDSASAGDSTGSHQLYDEAKSLMLKSYDPGSLAAALADFQKISADTGSDLHLKALAEAELGRAYLAKYAATRDDKLLSQAESAENKALQDDPNCAPALAALAKMTSGRDTPHALDLAQQALRLDSNLPEAHEALSDVYSKQGGHFSDALKEMQKAVDLAPEDDWSFPIALGSFYLSNGHYQDAEKWFQQVAQAEPENPVASRGLGIVDLRLGKLPEAREEVMHSLAQQPDPTAYAELSWLDIGEHKFTEAIEAALQETKLTPEDYHAWANLGTAYTEVPGDEAKALAAYRHAIDLAEQHSKKEPKNEKLIASLAYYYARAGNADRSRTLLRRALALSENDPKGSDPVVAYITGETYEILGDRVQAIPLIASSIPAAYSVAEMERDPDLKTLRKDPAFQAMLRAKGITGVN
jgi:serine/threonine protein kinase/Tfp pilus assembly protein PilF